MAAPPIPRPRRASTKLVRRLALSSAAWLSRAVVALVFMLGMLATAGATRVVIERDLVVERGEETQGTSQAGFQVQSPRRIRAGAAALAHPIESPRAPRVLAPPRRAPAPEPSWQRPRRTDPPPEDDEERLG